MFVVLWLPVLVSGFYDRRGVWYALLAGVVYGLLFVVVGARHAQTIAWSKQHPWLDSLILIPLAFLALAMFTGLAALPMLGISVVAWIALIAVRELRRGGPRTA